MVKSLRKGLLVAIEGIDSAGKRTQSTLLESWLKSIGIRTRLISFPDYKTNIGKELKSFLSRKKDYPVEVRHMLFAANRWEKEADLRDWLSEKNLVIVNRYTESNLAYGVANNLNLKWLINLEKGLPKADIVLVLDNSPAELSNRKKIQKDRYEEDLELQKRARGAYLKLANRFHWVVLNGYGEIRSVHKQVVKAVSEMITKKLD